MLGHEINMFNRLARIVHILSDPKTFLQITYGEVFAQVKNYFRFQDGSNAHKMCFFDKALLESRFCFEPWRGGLLRVDC
jgi:hypothetical protein